MMVSSGLTSGAAVPCVTVSSALTSGSPWLAGNILWSCDSFDSRSIASFCLSVNADSGSVYSRYIASACSSCRSLNVRAKMVSAWLEATYTHACCAASSTSTVSADVVSIFGSALRLSMSQARPSDCQYVK